MGDWAACRLVDHNRACPGEDESERPDEFCRKALHTLSATQCSSQNESILPRISSRTRRVFSRRSSCVPVSLEGSSNGQCNRVVTPAKIGQPSASASLHTVTTNWNICPDVQTSKTRCVVFFEISIPSSRSASTTSGLILPGSNPALCASKNSPHVSFNNAAAIWLRALLCAQINRTLCFLICFPSVDTAPEYAARLTTALCKSGKLFHIAFEHRICLYAVL